MPRGLFVTGTDTDVGKSYLTALIARELRAAGVSVGIYKPVCSGAVIDATGQPAWSDIETHFQALGQEFDRDRICPQRFVAPLAPPVAARVENRTVDAELLRSGATWWRERVDFLLVEGVGGLLCPLTDTESVADLAAEFGDPLLVVSRLGLGTVNHTLLTLEVALQRGLQVAGVVLNEVDSTADPSAESNPREVSARCAVPVLGVLRHDADRVLEADGTSAVDWLCFVE